MAYDAKMSFQMLVDIVKDRFKTPDRLTSEWRITDRRASIHPRDSVTVATRMVAEQGRNGQYNVLEQYDGYTLGGDGYNSTYNPHSIIRNATARAFGLPDGTLSREDACAALATFEEQYVEPDPNHSLEKRIPHYSILTA